MSTTRDFWNQGAGQTAVTMLRQGYRRAAVLSALQQEYPTALLAQLSEIYQIAAEAKAAADLFDPNNPASGPRPTDIPFKPVD